MDNSLVFWAGKKAYEKIKSSGLRSDDVKVVAGAAGGPKWLVLSHLDRALFGSWFKGRNAPLFLMGASSGAWRFAAVSRNDPAAAIDRFQDAYIHQAYEGKPSIEEVSRQSRHILSRVLESNGPAEILNHPYLRLNIMTVRSRMLTKSDSKGPLFLGLLLAALGNLTGRKNLRFFFERALFSDCRDPAPFAAMNGFPLVNTPFDTRNLAPALLASGSIPWIMSGVADIPAAPAGVYRDGAIIDYHMDIPFLNQDDGIVLFPHYTRRIVPGWLDKYLGWRRPSAANMAHVLMVAPSAAFVERLPHRKIPDRKDFYRFKGDDKTRIEYWLKAAEMSRQLSRSFMAAVESGRIKTLVEPIPADLLDYRKSD
jgi:hypothetical protein